MTRFLGAVLVVLIAGCAPAPAALAPSAEPASTGAQSPTPSLEPVATAAPTPVQPSPQPAPFVQITPPKVALVSGGFPIGSLPTPSTASADELTVARASVETATKNLGEVLTRYQKIAQATAEERTNLNGMFDATFAPGPFAEVAKRWTFDGASDERTFTVLDPSIVRVYAKSWGRASYADVRLRLAAAGGGDEWTRELTVRAIIGRGNWRVIDALDAVTGRWLVGDAAQYSALALESEVTGNVASYLWNESYEQGSSQQFVQRDPSLSRFWRARADALNELNARFTSGTLVDRHFEGVTARIVRFDPASYLGDGVMTVSVSGRLMEKDGAGAVRQYPFTQQMKFLRSVRNGFVSLIVVDQQSSDGTWDSGGELALYANDAEFG